MFLDTDLLLVPLLSGMGSPYTSYEKLTLILVAAIEIENKALTALALSEHTADPAAVVQVAATGTVLSVTALTKVEALMDATGNVNVSATVPTEMEIGVQLIWTLTILPTWQ